MIESRGTVEWMGCCYGVDLQAGKAVVVRAERARGRVNCFPVSTGDPSYLDAVRSGRAVTVGCMTAAESFSCWLEVPFPVFQKALKVLPTLLDVKLPFALEDCVYSFMEGGPVGQAVGGDDLVEKKAGSSRALAVAARTVDVRKKLESYAAFGMDPVVVDQEGLALWTQGLTDVPVVAGVDIPRAVVYLGVDRATLVIGRGGEFISAHAIGQDRVAQIGRLLKSQLKSGSPKGEAAVQWLWAGPGASDAAAVTKLQDGLRAEWPGPAVVVDKPETFLARAVAERALLAGPLRCNLRTGSLLHSLIVKRTERELLWTASIALAAGVLLCAMNLAWGVMAGRREAGLEARAGELADHLAGYHVAARGEARLKVVREAMGPRLDTLRPFLRSYEPSLVDAVSSMADLAKKNDLRYETFSLGHDKMNVTGTAGNWKKCEPLLEFLRQRGFNVKLDRKESLADERVAFSVATTGGGNE